MDVLSIDVGLVAIVNPETQIVEGYNVFVGGEWVPLITTRKLTQD